MTPAGTSNKPDVQNKWEEDKHTHTHIQYYFKKKLNASKPSELSIHLQWKNCQKKKKVGTLATFGKYFILPRFFAQFFCSDVSIWDFYLGSGENLRCFWRRIRHDVAISLALIDLKIHRIFARCTHTRHMHTHQRKGLSGFRALI